MPLSTSHMLIIQLFCNLITVRTVSSGDIFYQAFSALFILQATIAAEEDCVRGYKKALPDLSCISAAATDKCWS